MPSLSESLDPLEGVQSWPGLLPMLLGAKPQPFDPGNPMPVGVGAIRATNPRPALGNLWRMIVESEGKPAATMDMRGLPGGPATVEMLEGFGKRPLTESKRLATEAADFLRGRGYTGLQFSPMGDQQASPAARTRLFEYLLGRRATPGAGLEQVIPFGP